MYYACMHIYIWYVLYHCELFRQTVLWACSVLEVGKLLSILLNVPNSGHRNLSWHPMRQWRSVLWKAFHSMNRLVAGAIGASASLCGQSCGPAHGPDFSLPVPASLKGFLWPPEPLCPCVYKPGSAEKLVSSDWPGHLWHVCNSQGPSEK